MRSGYNIHIPIPVHVCCIDRVCSICTCCYISSRPSRICSPVILIPSNGVVISRSRYDIHIPISVHISRIDIPCTSCTCCYISSSPCRICSSVILIPSYSIILLRSRYNIHIPISVHICCKYRVCTICTCCYISSGPSRICSSIILIPSYSIILIRSRYNVHIPISVQICHIYTPCSISTCCYISSGPPVIKGSIVGVTVGRIIY